MGYAGFPAGRVGVGMGVGDGDGGGVRGWGRGIEEKSGGTLAYIHIQREVS